MWIMRISGMKTTKYQCFVLCLKTYIPSHVPRLPPMMLAKNRAFSETLQTCFFALCLSIPMSKNPITFIIARYTKIVFLMFSFIFIHPNKVACAEDKV